MNMETNLAAVKIIAPIARDLGLPLSVDWQDGYGSRLEEGLEQLLDLGAVGINLEDCDKVTQTMMTVRNAADRVRRVMAVAKRHGIDDFVINARSDTLLHGGTVSDAIERGRAYLAAGATTIFVWGGRDRGGITQDEVVELSKAFGGKLNVSLKTDGKGLTVKKLAKIGVARISVGPALQLMAMETFAHEAEKILSFKYT
jgi:2-methylisocitrate lyase-like PEP mutase family enzyme